MNEVRQTLVGNIGNKNIYLISDQNLPFYVSIPNTEKATIVLNLVDDTNIINPSNSNIETLTNNINYIYSKFNIDDIAVVTPIIDNNILEQVKLNSSNGAYSYLNKAMGYLINTTYRYLKNNNKQVFEKIKLNKNDSYQSFNDRFITMYKSRVELIDYTNVPAPMNRFENTTESEPTVNLTDEKSKEVEAALANTRTISLDDVNQVNDELDSKTLTKNKEPGFVSYVLLGVIVAVISLVALYMLL